MRRERTRTIWIRVEEDVEKRVLARLRSVTLEPFLLPFFLRQGEVYGGEKDFRRFLSHAPARPLHHRPDRPDGQRGQSLAGVEGGAWSPINKLTPERV